MYPSVRLSRVADAARASVEQLEFRRLLSADCTTIDFETAANGSPLSAGQIIDNEFAGYGITVTTNSPAAHPAMIFDSSNPSGGDVDLGSPNQDFGGPGIGAGGGLGDQGANSLSHENILIISEDADSSDPDDNANGGKIIFTFNDEVVIKTASLLDIDTKPASIKLYNDANVLIGSFSAQMLGDNSFQTLNINMSGVRRMELQTTGSLGMTGFEFCEDDTPPPPPPTNQECLTINFETDSSGNPIAPGQVIDNEFAAYGITVTTNSPVAHPAMVFDSNNPTGGDVDLGSPNEDFGGPGIGNGGGLGDPGANILSHENILIISEDADSSDPDDNANGGRIIFTFDEPVTIQDAGLLDIEDSSSIRLYNASNVLIGSFTAQELGDNSFQRIVMNVDNVKRMEVVTGDSLGFTDFTFCREGNGEPPPVKEGRMTGGGSIFLPAGAIGGSAGTRVTHGFQLHCASPPEEVNNRLQVNWGKPAQRFHLENLTSVTCLDTALIQAPPDAPIDTLIATGVGRFSGNFGGTKYNKAPATISFVFTDAGEPGVNDRASYLIQIDGGPVVLNTDSNDAGVDPDQILLTFGNHQAHNEIPKYTSTFLSLQNNVVSTFDSLDATNINEMRSMSLVNDLLNLFNQQEATVQT